MQHFIDMQKYSCDLTPAFVAPKTQPCARSHPWEGEIGERTGRLKVRKHMG